MTTRINTLWIEFSEDSEKPNTRECFRWILNELSNLETNLEDKILGIQYEPNGIYIKFTEANICQNIVDYFKGEAKIQKDNGLIIKVTIKHAGIGIKQVRILRLPFELPNIEIIKAIQEYGEVISCQDEYWSEQYAGSYRKFKNGNRTIKCNLKTHVPSFLFVRGLKALAIYEGQPKTCAYCGSTEHLIANCQRRINRENRPTYSSILSNDQRPSTSTNTQQEHEVDFVFMETQPENDPLFIDTQTILENVSNVPLDDTEESADEDLSENSKPKKRTRISSDEKSDKASDDISEVSQVQIRNQPAKKVKHIFNEVFNFKKSLSAQKSLMDKKKITFP